jgi:hypothetical protein
LPAGSGASWPVVEGKPVAGRGRVSLPLRVRRQPKGTSGRGSLRARGRLCLYHENNLLQSAAVSVGRVARASEKLRTRNRINIDFRLTGTYRDIGEKFGTRHLDEGDARKVGLKALNDDGGGNHRILLKSEAGQAPAWVPYDPGSMKDLLGRCRDELLGIFMTRDETGVANNASGLDGSNGKTKRQFELDIYVMARLGEQLLSALTQQINPESGSAINWVRDLQRALEQPTVIQVARTGTTQERWAEPEMYRVRGTLLLAVGKHAAAEESYRQALALAQLQSAKFWELRAAL